MVAASVSIAGANAGTGEGFNSRNDASLNHLRAYLQNHCWIFRDFDVNRNGWKPSIEGDGAMVSGIAANSSYSGIYSPVLKLENKFSISFSYKFSKALAAGASRSFVINLTDANGNIVHTLDKIQFSTVDPFSVYEYNKSFSAPAGGPYKVFINYQGTGGETRVAIDNISFDAPEFYTGGCGSAPLANDIVIDGEKDRYANGSINLSKENAGQLKSYVVTNSPDGTVTMNADGAFSFIPNEGFKGNSTSFTYKVCDLGTGGLCSEDAKVTVNFPNDDYILPQSLTDFNGIYKDGGVVQINWVTNFEQNTDRFEVERSLDGAKWEKAGALRGQGISATKFNYSFLDKVGRNTANKRDLYYRLKQVNSDQKSAYSRILVVRVFNTRSTKMISITPNPVKNDIAVNVQLNENAFVVMKIINNSGSEVMRKAINATEGTSNYVMDGTSKLNPGMYYLEVIVNSKERMLAKLLKE
jgi:hypothetical protein